MSLTGVISTATTDGQAGSGGLSTILNQETYKQIMFRPMAVNRLDVNVGERPIRGISQMRNANYVPVDSNIRFTRDDKRFFGKPRSNTARLGQSLNSLPDRRNDEQVGGNFLKGAAKNMCMKAAEKKCDELVGNGMDGEGFLDDAWKGVKKGAKAVGKTVVKGAKAVGKEAVKVGKFIKDEKLISKGAKAAGVLAGVLGQPEMAIPFAAVGQAADQFGLGIVSDAWRRAPPRRIKQIGKGPGQLQTARMELPGMSAGPRGNDRQSFVPTHPMNFNKARLNSL